MLWRLHCQGQPGAIKPLTWTPLPRSSASALPWAAKNRRSPVAASADATDADEPAATASIRHHRIGTTAASHVNTTAPPRHARQKPAQPAPHRSLPGEPHPWRSVRSGGLAALRAPLPSARRSNALINNTCVTPFGALLRPTRAQLTGQPGQAATSPAQACQHTPARRQLAHRPPADARLDRTSASTVTTLQAHTARPSCKISWQETTEGDRYQ